MRNARQVAFRQASDMAYLEATMTDDPKVAAALRKLANDFANQAAVS